MTVELKPFNDRALNRDLQAVCTKVAQTQPHLPDGRRLLFREIPSYLSRGIIVKLWEEALRPAIQTPYCMSFPTFLRARSAGDAALDSVPAIVTKVLLR